jgi:transcription elongation GreA/GreB family factor
MSHTQNHHQQFEQLLAQNQWDRAEEYWINLTDELEDQPELLLILLRDLAEAGQASRAAELAGLLAPTLQKAGKDHEWLFALKLQANSRSPEKNLAASLLTAYQKIYGTDPRWKAILSLCELEMPRVNLMTAIKRTDTLLALKEGMYCRHKSWGFGRIKQFDAALQKIIIAFPHNPEHSMQLVYAADSLTPVGTDHIEVRKLTDLAGLKALAEDKPLDLLRDVLLSHGRSATADQVEACLSGSVVEATAWKKWWESAKKRLKKDPHFDLPAKKTEKIVLRSAPVSQQDELLESFRNAKGLVQKVDVARQMLKTLSEIESPDLLIQEFQDGLLEALRGFKMNRPIEHLEAIYILDQLGSHAKTPAEPTTPMALDVLNRGGDLSATLDGLTAAAQKFAVAILKANRPELLTQNLNYLPAKVLDEMSDIMASAALQIEQRIRNQTAKPDLLLFVAKQLSSDQRPAWVDGIPQPAIIQAMLTACESTDKSAKKLRELIGKDESLMTDLLVDADTETIRNIGRNILTNSAFDELDRRSLMGKLVKEFPFVQELLVTKTVQEQPMIVSWKSLEKRKAELDEIIQKKIPANSKEIALARSYGDLRENFEYKAAKDNQRLLMRRRGELELLIARATPTDFSEVKTDSVQIGTSVTVTNLDSGTSITYHILGAWDGDPDRNIISYPAALAQAMLYKKPGDEVSWKDDAGAQRFRIDRVEKVSDQVLTAL